MQKIELIKLLKLKELLKILKKKVEYLMKNPRIQLVPYIQKEFHKNNLTKQIIKVVY